MYNLYVPTLLIFIAWIKYNFNVILDTYQSVLKSISYSKNAVRESQEPMHSDNDYYYISITYTNGIIR